MLKVHALTVSNYSSMLKFALLEKKIDYEWIETPPFSISKDESIFDKTTLGAVPFIEYEGNYISEIFAIFEFLEKKYPEVKLMSSDPLESARTIEIMNICQLYIELQARNFYPHVFFGGEKKEDNIESIKETINMGLKSLEKKATLNQYMVNNFSYADIFASLAIWPSIPVCKQIYDWDILDDYSKIQQSLKIIDSREAGKKTYDDITKGMEAMNRQ